MWIWRYNVCTQRATCCLIHQTQYINLWLLCQCEGNNVSFFWVHRDKSLTRCLGWITPSHSESMLTNKQVLQVPMFFFLELITWNPFNSELTSFINNRLQQCPSCIWGKTSGTLMWRCHVWRSINASLVFEFLPLGGTLKMVDMLLYSCCCVLQMRLRINDCDASNYVYLFNMNLC